jgi:hypothetical protein
VNILRKLFGEKDVANLEKVGLIDSSRFHSRRPINRSIAEHLVEIPSLKVIQFQDVKPDLRTLEVLNDVVFTKRKDITLRVYGYPDTWAEIDLLNYLPEVERFDWDTRVFGSKQPLYQLKKLVHLGLGFTQPKPKISLSFLTDFQDTLESIRLEGDYKDTLHSIPQLHLLKSVWFRSVKLDGFEFLKGLPIETLGNYGGRVASFDYLCEMKSLKKLWLKTNATLGSIDFIEKLTNLESIELFYLAKITKFPNCDRLSKLKRVFAFSCNRLVDISSLKRLNGVQICVSGNSLQGKFYKTENFIL